MKRWKTVIGCLCGFFIPAGCPAAARNDANAPVARGTLKLTVTDKADGRPLGCRVYLLDGDKKPVPCPPWPFWQDHFTCNGTAELTIPAGDYTYEIESGKEFFTAAGSFLMAPNQTLPLTVALGRFADMTAAGWYAGDLHNHRAVGEMPLLMQAENIHISLTPWWWINPPIGRTAAKNADFAEPMMKLDGHRFLYLRGGEDERNDGTAIYLGLPENLDIPEAAWFYPPVVERIEAVMKIPGAWIHLDHLYWWEIPAWLACGRIDSAEVINNNFERSRFNDTEAWGRPRDLGAYPPGFGNAVYQQDVYFHILNCGFRIPPAAGSASGVPHSPFGYNRVYVKADAPLTWDGWWQGLRAGRCFVTNGPLLQVKANGQWPGHVFTAPAGQAVSIQWDVQLDSRDTITRIEVIRNGRVVQTVPYEQWQKSPRLDRLEFLESGWCLVRVLTENPQTYRFAMTGPFYVETGGVPHRISRSSAQFFLDWALEAAPRIGVDEPSQRAVIDGYHQRSIQFWRELLTRANAD